MQKETKEKEYEVVMDIFLMETAFVKAKNKKEAFQIARDESEHNDGATEFTIFEINEI